MILTNKYNLPEIIVRAMGESYAPQIGRVAVTALIDSPLIRYLKIKHWNELTEDASDRLYALMGNGTHYIIQKGRAHTDQIEEYMKLFVNGMYVTGKSDIIQGDELNDIKVTSVYSFLLGEKEAWSKQINVYNYMAHTLFKKDIKKASVYGILRDWAAAQQYHNSDYPPIPFFEQPIELWPLEKTKSYVEARVLLHQGADLCLQGGADIAAFDSMLLCSDADRWLKPTTYAVKKGSNKRAERVLDSFVAANQWMIDNGKTGKEFSVETRPGEAVRCERFCICKPVCPMYGGKL